MKRLFMLSVIFILSVILSACGENVSATSIPSTESEETIVNFEGEGAGQGVIKSDEDLEALKKEEDEISKYSSGEDYNTYVIEKAEEEKPVSKYKAENYPDYVPMDGFWISDSEFDLIGWYEANGAIIKFLDMYAEKLPEENSDTAIYAGYLVYERNQWIIAVGSDNYCAVRHGFAGESLKTICEYSSKEMDEVVKIKSDVNDFRVYKDSLEKMGEAMKEIKADPTNENLELN